MRYRLNEKTTVYAAPSSSTSPILIELQPGDEITVGDIIAGPERWHDVTLPDGRIGYISAKTKGTCIQGVAGASVFCPRCGGPVRQDRQEFAAGATSGLMGTLFHYAFAKYRCQKCGPIPHKEFPDEIRSAVIGRRVLLFVVGAILLIILIVILGSRQ